MKRRTLMAVLGTATLTWANAAQAQVAMGAVGVFSLLGDSVQASWAENRPTDTRLERSGRETLEFKGIGFDQIALRVARQRLASALPSTRVALFQSPTAMTPAEQRSLADGAERAELPGWMVKTLEENKLTHLLIVTRHRGTIDARTGDGNAIGRGTVEGIGFFIDTLYIMRNGQTGAISTGLLAPYTQIRLTLMDAVSGEIVSTYNVRDGFAYAPLDSTGAADPWNQMPAEEKVRTLRRLVESGMNRGMVEVLKKR